MVNVPKLKGRIVEKFGSQSAFAEAWGKSDSYVSAKLLGSISFTYDDISEWVKILEIETCDIGIYFFA